MNIKDHLSKIPKNELIINSNIAVEEYLKREYKEHRKLFYEYMLGKALILIIQALGRGRRNNNDYCGIILVDKRYNENCLQNLNLIARNTKKRSGINISQNL